jgi:DNA-binding NarL/FixJ family response regulator
VRVVIAEDSVLLREGVVKVLTASGFEVAAAVPDAEQFLAAMEEYQPELAVVDVRMPPTHTIEGLKAAVEVRRRWPRTAVLVLSQVVEERYAGELLAFGSAGPDHGPEPP